MKKDLNNLLKKLYDTKFFKDVNLYNDKGNLIINVIENPIIENIEITKLFNTKTLIKPLLKQFCFIKIKINILKNQKLSKNENKYY